MNKYTLRKQAVKSVIWTVATVAGFTLFKGILMMNTVETLVSAAALYAAMFAESAFTEFIGETFE